MYTHTRMRFCTRIHTRRHRARMCFPVWEPALNASDGSRVDLRRDICYFTVVSRFARGNKAIVCSTYTLRPSELTGRAANRRSRRSGMRGALSKSVDLRPHPVGSSMSTSRLALSSSLRWAILNFFLTRSRWMHLTIGIANLAPRS